MNNAEMQVLKMMDRGAKYDSDFYQYRNALRIYFNRDNVSITQVQADKACEYLLNYYDSYVPDDPQQETKFFDTFLYVLMHLGVRVIYDRANSTADFIGNDGSIVMSKLALTNVQGGRTVTLNPIKQTGAPEDSSSKAVAAVSICTAALAIVSFGLALAVKKRKVKNLTDGTDK